MNIELIAKIKKIKFVAFDVDGTMTDGSLTFTEDGKEIKTYNAKDGQGIVLLEASNIHTAIITARENETVRLRAKMLGMKELYEGQKNKLLALEDICKRYNLEKEEIAYMGDDLPDICILKEVGISACPNDAIDDVKNVCNFIASRNGGYGAVRELCDLVLKTKN